MKKEKNVVEYYVLCNKLKNVIRTGWKNWNVEKERLESVAEHVYGVQCLAIAMYSEYQYDIDLYKVILMLAVHELEEIIIGDQTYWDISEVDKLEQGHLAIKQILSNLIEKELIEKIILEFDKKETKEALFAYHCDKLECDIQCKLYDEEGFMDITNQQNNPVFKDEKIQNIIKNGETTCSGVWLEYDRSKYLDDSNFMDVFNYVKDNHISLVDLD